MIYTIEFAGNNGGRRIASSDADGNAGGNGSYQSWSMAVSSSAVN